MQLNAVELLRVDLPVVDPIKTAVGGEDVREILLVRADLGEAEGWGECVAFQSPFYSSEYQQAAVEVLERHLVPALQAADEPLTPERLPALMASVKGHKMAKAGLECAVVDALLRVEGRSLKDWLGGERERVEVGVSVGIQDSLEQLVDTVGGYLEAGYTRVKLKVGPGWDLEPVTAIRSAFGDELRLQADANCAYDPAETDSLEALDRFGMLLIEQPFASDELLAHAALAERLETPVCLDESITSAAVCETALALRACEIVNIKLGRVGGLAASRAIHDLCAERGVPVWCGGMLESGVGRAVNLALASLPNFTLPGDISASRRYFSEDVTEPFEQQDGTIAVPDGPGIGVVPQPEALERLCRERLWIGR